MTYATKIITIDAVLDAETGDELQSSTIINRAFDASFINEQNIRGTLADIFAQNKERKRLGLELIKTPYLCPDCLGNLRLNKIKNSSTYYFIHAYKNDGCPSIGRKKLSEEQVFARQYNGKKEGHLHKTLKSMVCQSLKFSNDFLDLKEEKYVWNTDRTRWRKPDIIYEVANHILPKYAFEIQVSYTFVSIIYERKIFYQAEGIPLLWIFNDVDFSFIDITRDDALFANNCNIFTVTDFTLELSKQKKTPIFECHYMEPKIVAEGIEFFYKKTIVPLSEMQYDLSLGVIYYYNFKKELHTQKRNLLKLKLDSIQDKPLSILYKIDDHLRQMGVNLSALNDQEKYELYYAIQYIFSAFEGRCIGSNLKSLSRIMEEIDKRKPYCFIPFVSAVSAKENGGRFLDSFAFNEIKSQDLRERIKNRYNQSKQKPKELCPSLIVVKCLEQLFPEIKSNLEWYVAK